MCSNRDNNVKGEMREEAGWRLKLLQRSGREKDRELCPVSKATFVSIIERVSESK